MKRMESLGIINLEDKHRGNTSYDPIICDKKLEKKINSLEISLKTIVDIIKKKDTYLIVGDSKTVINILNSSESLKFYKCIKYNK